MFFICSVARCDIWYLGEMHVYIAHCTYIVSCPYMLMSIHLLLWNTLVETSWWYGAWRLLCRVLYQCNCLNCQINEVYSWTNEIVCWTHNIVILSRLLKLLVVLSCKVCIQFSWFWRLCIRGILYTLNVCGVFRYRALAVELLVIYLYIYGVCELWSMPTSKLMCIGYLHLWLLLKVAGYIHMIWMSE